MTKTRSRSRQAAEKTNASPALNVAVVDIQPTLPIQRKRMAKLSRSTKSYKRRILTESRRQKIRTFMKKMANRVRISARTVGSRTWLRALLAEINEPNVVIIENLKDWMKSHPGYFTVRRRRRRAPETHKVKPVTVKVEPAEPKGASGLQDSVMKSKPKVRPARSKTRSVRKKVKVQYEMAEVEVLQEEPTHTRELSPDIVHLTCRDVRPARPQKRSTREKVNVKVQSEMVEVELPKSTREVSPDIAAPLNRNARPARSQKRSKRQKVTVKVQSEMVEVELVEEEPKHTREMSPDIVMLPTREFRAVRRARPAPEPTKIEIIQILKPKEARESGGPQDSAVQSNWNARLGRTETRAKPAPRSVKAKAKAKARARSEKNWKALLESQGSQEDDLAESPRQSITITRLPTPPNGQNMDTDPIDHDAEPQEVNPRRFSPPLITITKIPSAPIDHGPAPQEVNPQRFSPPLITITEIPSAPTPRNMGSMETDNPGEFAQALVPREPLNLSNRGNDRPAPVNPLAIDPYLNPEIAAMLANYPLLELEDIKFEEIEDDVDLSSNSQNLAQLDLNFDPDEVLTPQFVLALMQEEIAMTAVLQKYNELVEAFEQHYGDLEEPVNLGVADALRNLQREFRDHDAHKFP